MQPPQKIGDAFEQRDLVRLIGHSLAQIGGDPRQAERRTITRVSGNALTLDRALEYMHFGEVTFGVDQRGEVGLLTRNVRVQASQDAEQSYFGGHIMAMIRNPRMGVMPAWHGRLDPATINMLTVYVHALGGGE